MRLTLEQLLQILPEAGKRAAAYLPHLLVSMEKHQINNPKRIAAFLAQIGHESGSLRYAREIWGPTEAQKRYDQRTDLGNTPELDGDGKKFLGLGLQTAAGVPLQCDEPADFRTFRIGLFGLDKLHHIDRTVAYLEQALNQLG